MTDAADWLEQARRLAAGLGQTLGQAREPADGATAHPADCRWCPVCQVAAVVRGERPEVTAALADLLDAASTALRSFAESASTAAEPPVAEPEQRPAPAEPVVQRIEIA
jgi:hypothetical protein